jgi:PAS domain S-box-containing protein
VDTAKAKPSARRLRVATFPSERVVSELGLLESLVEQSSDALIALDLGGTVLCWNRAACEVFGDEPAEAVGGTLEDLVVLPEEREQARAHWAAAPKWGSGAFEATRRRKDGTVIQVKGSERVVRDAQGRPLFIAMNQREVTQLTHLKSEFLANMDHELRSPLNAIIGFADLMFQGKVGAPSTLHKEYLGDILNSSHQLLQLITDVLAVAKVDSGKMEFRPEPVQPSKVIGEVQNILRGFAASKRIQVYAEVDATLSLVVLDPAKLKQVIYSYLSNALKFTAEGGKVVIRALGDDDGALRIEVEDSGIGISHAELPRLFVEFQQLGVGAAKKYAGAGLGLALTKRIVEAQGGSVSVRSEPGRGSVFSAVLPRKLAAAATPT